MEKVKCTHYLYIITIFNDSLTYISISYTCDYVKQRFK